MIGRNHRRQLLIHFWIYICHLPVQEQFFKVKQNNKDLTDEHQPTKSSHQHNIYWFHHKLPMCYQPPHFFETNPKLLGLDPAQSIRYVMTHRIKITFFKASFPFIANDFAKSLSYTLVWVSWGLLVLTLCFCFCFTSFAFDFIIMFYKWVDIGTFEFFFFCFFGFWFVVSVTRVCSETGSCWLMCTA